MLHHFLTTQARLFAPAFVLLLCAPACADDTPADDHSDDDTSDGDGDGDGDTSQDNLQISLSFGASVGDRPAACGQTYDGVGSQATTVEIQDLRFFVSGIELLDANGDATALTLEQDGLWQYQDLALLDFEDGSAACQDGGTTELNHAVIGTVPAGDYSGVRFTLGVPFELNHQDVANAPSPLNLPSMFWTWQGGYKFARIDLRNDDPADNAWLWHQGSTGCSSGTPEQPPEEICLRSNRLTIELPVFDHASQTIVLDVGAMLADVDVGKNTPMTAPGCMSGLDDPECAELFPQLGLDLATGACLSDCSDQLLFRIE